MIDSALSSLGATVVVATSSDENHPPENITDGNTKTFWMSTGMFPQEFIIRFAEPSKISTVTVDSYNDCALKTIWCLYPASVHGETKKVAWTEPHNTISAMICLSVKHLKIEKNTSPNTSQFEFVTEKEFEHTEGHLQSNAFLLNGSSANHLRFIISSGYDHFVSVHRISVQHLHT
ncbi:intraflagellar transport protein 25 homolog isoform X1 [Micropterus dolomieu]|uniref:intraflagellar transport protein 25 homolog isoform X1 n=1 Tax=Micropterus dolomieu TaxID=147949 RepID=UPI001E8E70C4|nr:intraflagellar transport protein 25 homolog isoform X1 [Micropterus dolomieu]XP_045890462.1 intraflagellar transport protein 25 homolog isoform X1 [Micropterus dolomieu]